MCGALGKYQDLLSGIILFGITPVAIFPYTAFIGGGLVSMGIDPNAAYLSSFLSYFVVGPAVGIVTADYFS